MKTNNIKKGQAFKNYRELCEVLDEKVSSGNTKKAQLKEFGRFFNYHKEGNKFIIDEIYEIPKDKEDKRVNNGTETIFREDIEKLIIHMCSLTEESKYKKMELSINGMLSTLNMINSNYNIGRHNINKFSRYMEIPIETIRDFYDSTYTKNKKLLESGLNKLQNKCLIKWFNILRVCTKSGEYRTATDQEIECITELELEALKKVNKPSKKDVYLSGKWVEYQKEVNKLLREYTNFNFTFQGYNIITTKNFRKMLLNVKEKIETENKLNKNIVESSIKSAEKRHQKVYDECSATFGKNKTPEYSKDKNRLTDKYINDTKTISDMVINNTNRINLGDVLKEITDKKYDYCLDVYKKFYDDDLEFAEYLLGIHNEKWNDYNELDDLI